MPIVPRFHAPLTGDARARCAAAADQAGLARSLARDRLYFGPAVRPRVDGGPFIFFGDTHETRGLAARARGSLEYRLSLLAGAGDLVVLGGARIPAFETYVAARLGLGVRRYLPVAPGAATPPEPTQRRCLDDPVAYAALRAFVAQGGGATLVPYAATGAIWSLARRLAGDTGARVDVAGPPPAITRAANDKLVFSAIVRALLGDDAAPTEIAAHGPAALAGRVHQVARGCRKLVIKLPDSAGSAGNFPMFSADLAGMPVKELHRHLQGRLGLEGGAQRFPVIVQVWQNSVFSSPSIQLWIPRPEDGPPVIEGVFHQIVTGPEGRFVGARPADPEEGWIPAFCHQGQMIGQAFQEIGFFGRCSFDAVLYGDDPDRPRISWLECNGRWGGVSIPMTLLNRLFAGRAPPPYAIIHLTRPGEAGRPFDRGLELLEDMLWAPGREHGIIFMTPGGFEAGADFHMISLAPTPDDALAQAERAVARLAAG